MKKLYDSCLDTARVFWGFKARVVDMYRNKYISYRQVVVNFFKNRHLQYRIIKDRQPLEEFKTSDTIFLLGNGPSLNDITSQQWAEISHHDSFGINFSFLLDFVPTYHLQELNPFDLLQQTFIKTFKSRQAKYHKVVWCCNNKMPQRFGHPRLTPLFFPERPICYYYKLPPAISLGENRPFRDEDFERGLLYRGTLSQALELAVNHFRYRNIVLLGMDLNTYDHFYSNIPEMNEFWSFCKKHYENEKKMFPLMIPKEGTRCCRPLDEYLYSLRGYLERKRNIKLFTCWKKNTLYPGLPAYFD